MPSIRSILLVVGVPALLLAGVLFGVGLLEGQFREALITEFGFEEIPAGREDDLKLAAVCQDPDTRRALPACTDSALGQILTLLGVAAVGLSILSIALTVAATRYAGTDRGRLAATFGPALTIIQVIVVLLILFEGALAVGGGYLLEVGLIGSYHPAILLGIGFVALVAARGVLGAMLGFRRRMTMEANGLPVDPASQPRLVQFAAEVAASVGTRPPDVIVVGLDPTFYVTEADVTTLDGPRTGRLLYLSLPLSRIFSVNELRAVVGHEMGHFKGEDTRYSQRFAPVYRSAIESFAAVSGAARGFYGVVLIPSLEILGSFLNNFAGAERAVQRQRELEADKVGAGVASARDVATSLIKLQAFVPLWDGIIFRTVRSIGLGKPAENPSVAFADRARQGATAASVETLEGTVVAHPTDSHPPLRDRLANVAVEFDSVAEGALSGAVDAPAIELVAGADALESQLTSELVSKVKDELGFAGPGFDTEGGLRELAESAPAVARAIDLVERAHAGTLMRPLDFNVRWQVLVPLAIAPHPTPHAFLSTVDVATLPPGDQQLVIGFATESTPPDQVLAAGTEVKPIGMNNPEERRAGYAEDIYVGEQVYVVQSVGSGEITAQVAGLFLVPQTDPMAQRGQYAAEIADLRPALVEWQASLTGDSQASGAGG